MLLPQYLHNPLPRIFGHYQFLKKGLSLNFEQNRAFLMTPHRAHIHIVIENRLRCAKDLLPMDDLVRTCSEMLVGGSNLRLSLFLGSFLDDNLAPLHLGLTADTLLQNELTTFDYVDMGDLLAL